MEKLTKDISEIITNEIGELNDKVRGLNFLEILKAKIIEKISLLVNKQKFPLEKEISFENEIIKNSRHIKITVNYFLKSISLNKKKMNNDSLFIYFNEISNIDIFEDKKNFTSLSMYKNTGISVPKDTIINSQHNKNLLLIEINNKETEQILTN